MHFSLLAAPTVCWCRHHHSTTPPQHYTTLTQSFIQTISTSTVNSLIMASVACNMLRCIWDCWVVPEAVWMVPSNFMINSRMWYKCNINNHYFRSHGFHSGATCSVQICCVTLGCSGLLCENGLFRSVVWHWVVQVCCVTLGCSGLLWQWVVQVCCVTLSSSGLLCDTGLFRSVVTMGCSGLLCDNGLFRSVVWQWVVQVCCVTMGCSGLLCDTGLFESVVWHWVVQVCCVTLGCSGLLCDTGLLGSVVWHWVAASCQSVYSSNPRSQPKMQQYLLDILWQLIVLVPNTSCFVTCTLTRKDWLQFGTAARVPNKKQNVQNLSLPCLLWFAKLGASV